MTNSPQRNCWVVDLGLMAYAPACGFQRELVEARKANAIPDVLLLCEHPHVITLGRNGKREHLRASASLLKQMNVEFHSTNRGGDITYHGPGQLVGYPILNFAEIRRDVAWYVRDLEEAMIRATAEFGIVEARRRPHGSVGRVCGNEVEEMRDEEKLGAIGVHLSRWVTSHGFAYNVSTDLRYFDLIVPCGIAGSAATSLEKFSAARGRGRDVPRIAAQLGEILGLQLRSKIAGRWKRCCSHLTSNRLWQPRRIGRFWILDKRKWSLEGRGKPVNESEHGCETHARTAPRSVLLHAAQPRARGADGAALPPEQNRRRLYSSLGQEAISVGTAYALGPGDWIAPMIRNIGALLVRGFKPRDIMTQHMARYTSPTQGKDGTSHFGDLKVRHVVSPISMLGDLIPVMTGIAMAGRYLGQKIVTMTWIGDGGTSTGVFHEGLNFAAVQKAPLVLIVENNQWAYSTPVESQVPVGDLADRAKAYGIRSAIVDGNDVVAVYARRARRWSMLAPETARC